MSEHRVLLCETAERLFARVAGLDVTAVWPLIADAGFGALLVPEEDGGFGGDWGDLVAVARLAGGQSFALPVGETIVATWAVARAGLGGVDGVASISPRTDGQMMDGCLTGVCHRVPWGRAVDRVATVLDATLLLLHREDATVSKGVSPAGEPRDTLTFDGAPVVSAPLDVDLFSIGALLRVAQIAGALDAALALAIDHANQRQQFGKPIAKFQSVQQNLAILAIEAGAANVAAAAAALALDGARAGDCARLEIAAAKLRANMAAATGIAIAHQVHGAIGFTRDYPLHRLTQRMMGWRSEFGNDRHWSEVLGGIAARSGGAGLWAEITRRSDID